MRVRFWGTRGSLAKPGPSTLRYGGNTSCVEVVSLGGTRLVIDCGTGGHELGNAIMAEGKPSRGHMLISHTHWDHIQGIPFFTPFFVPGHEWDLYAPQGFQESLKDALAGQMEYTYFPITLDAFGGKLRYHNLGEGSFTIDDVTIHTRYLNHPALTVAFRLEAGGAVVVYACDHEPHSRDVADGEGDLCGEDLAHAEFMRGADLIIHDAQYIAPEFAAKRGWGHSTVEYALRVGREAGARKLALTHHDPSRHDGAVDDVMAQLSASAQPNDPELFAAAEGMVIDVSPARTPTLLRLGQEAPSAIREGTSATVPSMLLIASDPSIAERIGKAVADEPVHLSYAPIAEESVKLARRRVPSLLLAEAATPGLFDLVDKIVRDAGHDVPLVLIGGEGPPGGGAVDRLEEPWSVEYARTRIRTWLLRAEAHWERPPIPEDEADRIAALHALDILDTPQEERFDRHTRLAAALFRVPVSLISIVDSDRQWFKSCFGADLTETPREVSFCAHAVAARSMLIVPDTLKDARFRDHPMVQGGPRLRFYAGAPIYAPGGQPIGTLCVIDTRPRVMTDEEQSLLRDLAGMIESEMDMARTVDIASVR
ncbi:GAF domain-containing protein [Sphingomonas crocodyli]|uniref:GAF domain-containing protein n=1 Tax=Sphingomonas crocodyli TaxID=1979270 RepID=A0A437M080_9SPHN|nr:GAF domain-containing protein [Sphingomonas crocodyli]RVT91100.1 GAF domain-containing protein [Sphingomonas crocodyli]